MAMPVGFCEISPPDTPRIRELPVHEKQQKTTQNCEEGLQRQHKRPRAIQLNQSYETPNRQNEDITEANRCNKCNNTSGNTTTRPTCRHRNDCETDGRQRKHATRTVPAAGVNRIVLCRARYPFALQFSCLNAKLLGKQSTQPPSRPTHANTWNGFYSASKQA